MPEDNSSDSNIIEEASNKGNSSLESKSNDLKSSSTDKKIINKNIGRNKNNKDSSLIGNAKSKYGRNRFNDKSLNSKDQKEDEQKDKGRKSWIFRLDDQNGSIRKYTGLPIKFILKVFI